MQTLLFCKNDSASRDKAIKNYLGRLAISKYDLLEVKKEEGKKNISIDQAKKALSTLYTKPPSGEYKVVVFRDAQDLSVQAQNALLKTLEEPPDYALIILSVNDLKGVLDTVRSRAQVIELDTREVVTLNDEEYAQAFAEVVSLLNGNAGSRIDWITNNRDMFKETGAIVKKLEGWEVVIRDLLLAGLGIKPERLQAAGHIPPSPGAPGLDAKSLVALIKTKQLVRFANINSAIAIETWLMNIENRN